MTPGCLFIENLAFVQVWVFRAELVHWVVALWSKLLLGDELSQVDDSLTVAPLVIVPGNHLDHIISHDHGQGGVDGGGIVAASVVNGDKWLIRDSEDSLHWSVSGSTEGVVNVLGGNSLLLHVDDEVNNRNVRGWNSESNTVQLSCELWQDEGDGLGGTSGGWDDAQGSGTGAPQISVGGIKEPLVSGVGVSCGHGSLDNTEALVQNLNERGEAVGGAGGVGNDWRTAVVLVLVDSNDVGWDGLILGRGGDDNLLGSSRQVLSGPDGVQEHASSLDDHVNTELLPRELEWVTA
mmetsp:Transcript_12888/g.24368  ORF Transcript_12888/g.24368 Transcript_12888/m.24368 type:complete len:293 (-) Transcript_12888:532-1410(-)